MSHCAVASLVEEERKGIDKQENYLEGGRGWIKGYIRGMDRTVDDRKN